MKYFHIRYKNKEFKVKEGTTFIEFIENDLKIDSKNVALCRLDREYKELIKPINRDGVIGLINFDNSIGYKIYTRTLQFIFVTAALEIFNEATITIEHSLSGGVYGEIHKDMELSKEDLMKIRIALAKKGINQNELAKKLGKNLGYMNRALNGKININRTLIESIEKELDCSLL